VAEVALELGIADSEIATRVARLQRELSERGLAAAICFGAHRDYFPADLRYLARWSCTDEETSYVFVPVEGESILITDAEWDLERAQTEAFAGTVVLDPRPADTLTTLVRRHAAGGRVGISGMDGFPVSVYLPLTAACDGVEFEDIGDVVTALRLVKSPAEIALIREAARISDVGMRAGIGLIREGTPEAVAAAAAEHAIRATGAELSFVTVMGAGPRTAQATFFPTAREMRAGELAVLDCGARVDGYHGDMCRTVTVGPPSALQRSMLEAVEMAVDAAVAAARPGALVGTVTAAAEQVVSEAGFGEYWWGYYMPHGAGAGQHEPPGGLADADMRLVAGMVLCVEPGIAMPGEGAVILEQMLHVTEAGAEVLNDLPLALWDSQ
jgi:Xaa-Pro aminopeptidase